MNRHILVAVLAGILPSAVVGGCQRSDLPGPTPESAPAATEAPGSACEPQRALDRMDTRMAVPLLPMMANHQKQNMRDHLLAVQEIVLAAASGEFAGIERAAARIGYSEQTGQMCTHMGAGAPGFTEAGLEFHHTADAISNAAREHDLAKVMSSLGSTLQTCTGCHATFRQDVVDEATWNRVSSVHIQSHPH